MATPVASNQLVTPRDLAQEGIWTNPTNTFLNMRDSSGINTIAQTLATNAWGSSTNYNTRIMTRQDIINTGVAAYNNITGYSTNQCPPFGPLYDYNNSFYTDKFLYFLFSLIILIMVMQIFIYIVLIIDYGLGTLVEMIIILI